MAEKRRDLIKRVKPIQEIVDKLGVKDSGADLKAFFDEMWGEESGADADVLKTGNHPDVRDEDLAEDPAAQLQMISAAYATGNADEIDRVVNYIALIRRLKKQGLYDLGRLGKESPDG
jgi:hypothetical protein